jgi:hypothetical protein
MISSRRFAKTSKRKSTVPNLSSRSRSQAQNDLVSRGLFYSDSSQNTSDSGLNLYVASQSVSAGDTVLLGSTVSFVYYNYVAPPVITYGSCEAYGSPIQNLGSGTQCSGTFYQEYTDYRYNTRKKIFSDGIWDGSSYTTSGCGTTDARSVTSSNQIAGLCGVPSPCTISSYSAWSYSGITWSGSCPSGTESGTATSRSRTDNCGNSYFESGSYAVTRSCTVQEVYGNCEAYTFTQATCNGEDSYVGNYTGYRKTSNLGNTTTSGCASAVFTGFGECIARNVSSCGGSGGASGTSCTPACSGLQGLPCGYNNTGTYDCNGTCVGASSPPETCVCNYSDYGSYYYSPQCCPSGAQRTGALGGTTSGSCCPNVNKTQKWQCKSYDVTNSASANYYTCYSVGECAASFNSDGSRTICYV